MKVIGVGFGRTGTASLKAALEQLGFGPCYHMLEVMAAPKQRAAQWMSVADGARPEWNEILDGYQATVDWPGTYFWRELVDAYPDAKVLLSVRDADKWYKSTANTIYRGPLPERSTNMQRLWSLIRVADPHMRHIRQLADKLIWSGTFDGRFADRDHAIDVFHRHIDEVKQYVPADRLLVYDVKQGWEPLCEFLDVAVPEGEFPHLNDTEAFQAMMRENLLRALVKPATAAAAVAGVATAGILWRKSRRR